MKTKCNDIEIEYTIRGRFSLTRKQLKENVIGPCHDSYSFTEILEECAWHDLQRNSTQRMELDLTLPEALEILSKNSND